MRPHYPYNGRFEWAVFFGLLVLCLMLLLIGLSSCAGPEGQKGVDASRSRYFNPLEGWFEDTRVDVDHSGDTGCDTVAGDQQKVYVNGKGAKAVCGALGFALCLVCVLAYVTFSRKYNFVIGRKPGTEEAA